MILREAFMIPSIDRQIFSADVIVLANFVSATAKTETTTTEGTSAYWPILTLNFTVVEYLKGTGPTNFSIDLRDDSKPHYWVNGVKTDRYPTQQKALEKAQELVRDRNTVYDNRSGVLFLKGPVTSTADATSSTRSSGASGNQPRSAGASASTTNYDFTLFNTLAQGTLAVSVDTMSRAWLPAESATKSEGSTGTRGAAATNPTLITNRPPPEGIQASDDPNTMTLSGLKTHVSEIAAMFAAGDGSAGYRDCVTKKLIRHEYYRGQEFPPLVGNRTISSGLPADTYFQSEVTNTDSIIFNTSGPAADYFAEKRVADGDGWLSVYATTRPLPAGKYTANFHQRLQRDLLCNHNPTHNNYITFEVTATAPAGTLHEAFFDPVTVGTAVKADGSNGVLKPTSFTVGSTSTEITSLEWSSNQVVLTLNPHVSLGSHVLDFIELDGSVSLSLSAADATVDNTAGAYSWSVTSQPWEDGDKLMLRIREES